MKTQLQFHQVHLDFHTRLAMEEMCGWGEFNP
jgi:hypothetical protein